MSRNERRPVRKKGQPRFSVSPLERKRGPSPFLFAAAEKPGRESYDSLEEVKDRADRDPEKAERKRE
jgi:hypothetical protein